MPCGEYVVGAMPNGSFRSIFKRGVVGTFHNASKKYLPLFRIYEEISRCNEGKNSAIACLSLKT